MTLLHKQDMQGRLEELIIKHANALQESVDRSLVGDFTPVDLPDGVSLKTALTQLIEDYTEDRVALAKQYMTPSRAQDYQNHLDGTLQNDPRLQLKSNRESV